MIKDDEMSFRDIDGKCGTRDEFAVRIHRNRAAIASQASGVWKTRCKTKRATNRFDLPRKDD
jgi:hypothetical protein